eukprot:CAMPEP_0171160014 /NCGR_PEP_ID=MMETSP0790-20130122/3338_1 /TAXON_ID=2925 /ORGANISM="Alexandrium catenella, Strain OF101" /LENGTH=364 /DNA_ID=CAMNT_0011624533 /DNA_START=35 /DNA_END=1125 /DNA_ORIENTATION=+
MRPASIGLVLAAITVGASAGITLWRGVPDKVPPYFSQANVSMAVEQDGDYRNFMWTADWWNSTISGEMNMGRMICPLSESERSHLTTLTLEERGRMPLPCNYQDPEKLLAGSEIVQQIVSSVAALKAKRVAMVGLGPGTQATYWQRYHPEIERIDVVELSSTVVDLAQQYFGLHPDRRLRIHVADGREWLKEAAPFDVFVHDATGSEHYFLWPSSLRLIREKSNGGAMVINMLGTPAPLKALLISYFRLYFAEVRAYSDVVVASWTPLVMDWNGLPDYIRAWQEQGGEDAYRSSPLWWTVPLLSIVVLMAVLRTAATKTNEYVVQFDEEELSPLAKLHPRAGFRFRQGFKECDPAGRFAKQEVL